VDLFYLLAQFQYREVVACFDFYLPLTIAEALRFCLLSLSMIAEAVSFCLLLLMIDEALLEMIGEGLMKTDEETLLALETPLVAALSCHCCLLVSYFPYELANREANTLCAYDHDPC
jgi:hypothetical protein